jgi:hypothetical protein
MLYISNIGKTPYLCLCEKNDNTESTGPANMVLEIQKMLVSLRLAGPVPSLPDFRSASIFYPLVEVNQAILAWSLMALEKHPVSSQEWKTKQFSTKYVPFNIPF